MKEDSSVGIDAVYCYTINQLQLNSRNVEEVSSIAQCPNYLTHATAYTM
jgi:hypothetical protein